MRGFLKVFFQERLHSVVILKVEWWLSHSHLLRSSFYHRSRNLCVFVQQECVKARPHIHTHTHRQRGQRRFVSETNSTAIKSKSAEWQHFAFPISHSIMQSFAIWKIMFVSLTKQRSSTHARHLHFILQRAAQHTWQHIERKIVIAICGERRCP